MTSRVVRSRPLSALHVRVVKSETRRTVGTKARYLSAEIHIVGLTRRLECLESVKVGRIVAGPLKPRGIGEQVRKYFTIRGRAEHVGMAFIFQFARQR